MFVKYCLWSSIYGGFLIWMFILWWGFLFFLLFWRLLVVIGWKLIEVLVIGYRNLVFFLFFCCLLSWGLCCWLFIWEGSFFWGYSICWLFGYLWVCFYFIYLLMIFCSIGIIVLCMNFCFYGSYIGCIIRLRRWVFLFFIVMLFCIICLCLIYGGLGLWFF